MDRPKSIDAAWRMLILQEYKISSLIIENEALRKKSIRWDALESLVCEEKVDLWIWSPVKQLNVQVQEGSDIYRFRWLFDKLLKENALRGEGE